MSIAYIYVYISVGTYEAIKISISKNQAFEALAGQDYFQYYIPVLSWLP